ncbi:MAG TPA: nuclear transport factor 2 family protein [Thermoanaerobaculia bacterium]|nr:nuclear transport factor 2 family protein [Thermoanaerobaculia bacterium]
MKRIPVLTCLMFVLVAPLFADCSSAEKKALTDFDHAWGAASTSGDRAALQQIYASDYMNVAPGNIDNYADTIDNAVRDAERNRGNAQPVITYDNYIITCTPVTATITHRNTITTTVDGKEHVNYTRSVHFLEKRNGRWQVVSNAGGPLSDGAQVAYLEQDWNDADMANNMAWFEKTYASDMTNVSSRTGKFTTKNEELASMRSRKGSTTFAELSNLNTRKEGDTVIATGINHVKGTDDDGKAFDKRVAFTDVWVKRDGRWQVLATQGTVMP